MSTATYEPINIRSLSYQTGGLILSFAKQAQSLSSSQGKNYTTAHQVHFKKNLPDGLIPNSTERKKISAPTTLGHFSNIDDGPDIIVPPIIVKPAASFDMGLPQCFNYVAPIGRHVGNDVLSLYGAEGFKRSQILFIAHRTTVESRQAQRKHASTWHNHLKEPYEVDLSYIFSTVLPTEFQASNKATYTPANNSLIRFGAEERHRSQTNYGPETRRLWGNFVVVPGYSDRTPDLSRVNLGENIALRSPLKKSFRNAGLAEEEGNVVGFQPHTPELICVAV